MKKTPITAAAAVLLLAAAYALTEEEPRQDDASAACREIAPRPFHGRVAQRLLNTLQDCHVMHRAFDDEMSRRAWTNLVSYYDFDRSLFLKSDLARLSEHETTLDDELKRGDVGFGFDLYNLYAQRLRERICYATNLLASAEWDFSTRETYRTKRKTAEWPETREAAEDHWRRRLKYEMLAIAVNRELDAEEAAKKEDEESGIGDGAEEDLSAAPEPPVPDAEASAASAGEDIDFDPARTPQENLARKYRQYVAMLTSCDEDTVMQNYMSAVCRSYDPHTDYFSPMSKEDFDMEMSLSLSGIGATLSMDEGALKIVDIMPGSPADLDGRLREGDRIVGVGQGTNAVEDILWQPMNKSIRKIRGPKGTRVTLEVVPRSDATGTVKKRYELVRDKIKLEDAAVTGRVEIVERPDSTNRLGYVYVPSFYGTPDLRPGSEGFCSCSADVARYLAEFNAMDVAGVILDLRGNGGGNLVEAIALSSRFVPSGPVVQVLGSSVAPLPISRGNVVSFRRPLVVLVDRVSASASEIVAAHLQDTGRAVVLGDSHTHGKGTVQTVMPLGPKEYGSLKVTTQRFYRVDGKSTQVRGVIPDIRIPSLLDSLDIGEDKLDGALPFTKILGTGYAKCWNMDSYVEELSRLSAERLAGDVRYERHLANVEGTKAVFDREIVPLEHDAFAEMARGDRAIREKSSSSQGRPGRRRRIRGAPDGDDVVLDEAFEVLADLVELNAGAELPRPQPSAMDWYNAIFGY